MDGQNRGDANVGTSATPSLSPPALSQLPALSPTLLTRRRTSIANTDKPLPNLQTHLKPAHTSTNRESKSAHVRRDSKVDEVALMLARAEVANDLLYSDPKRVVIEGGSLQADKDILRSLADVQSPMRTEAD
ncbi:hypothetical protein IW136_002693, partial [Coemansia sp. RSA 678]